MLPETLATERRVKFQNLVLLSDLGSGSERVLRYATWLARWYGAKLVVAHSCPPEKYVYVPAGPLPLWPPTGLSSPEDDVKKAEELVTSLGAWDVVSRVLTTESGVAGLLQELGEFRPDLLVAATHARTGLSKCLSGSVAEEVFRRASWPVLVLSPGCAARVDSDFRLRQVLFATDLSPVSGNALYYAAGIAHDHDAELLEMYVETGTSEDFTSDRIMALQKLEDWLHRHAVAHGEILERAEHVVRFGEPGREILDTAAAWNADLIVIGAHGMGAMSGVASHLVGGTAYEVVCASACPTLIVPPMQ